jgi:hypothetical protein
MAAYLLQSPHSIGALQEGYSLLQRNSPRHSSLFLSCRFDCAPSMYCSDAPRDGVDIDLLSLWRLWGLLRRCCLRVLLPSGLLPSGLLPLAPLVLAPRPFAACLSGVFQPAQVGAPCEAYPFLASGGWQSLPFGCSVANPGIGFCCIM